MAAGKTGILLVQLGGPTKREELKEFLYRLFADPEVLGIPFAPLRKAVAWAIATSRQRASAAIYERIGWSPIRCWTESSAMLLAAALADGAPGEAPVVRSAMTCSAPLVEEVLPELREAGVSRLLVLPLYPQYSVTTTKGSHARVEEALRRMRWSPEVVKAPDAWYDEPRFLDAHAARIEEAIATLPDADSAATVLLYSAHSLPVATVEKKKDPYPRQIEETCRLIDARLGGRFRSRLGYQSKLGPVAWLGPSTTEVLADLARDGARQVVVSPVAFVSDHVETLYEIRLLFAEEARRLGIPHYVAASGLNDHPAFIAALAGVCRRALGAVRA